MDGTVCERMERARIRTAGTLYGPAARVRALAHDAVGDVRVRADEVVGLDVLEQDPAVAVEPGPDPGLAGRPAGRLERLLEGQDQPHRATDLERREDHRRLVLGVLLAAEAAPGSGAYTRTFERGIFTRPAIVFWSQFGCWIVLQTAMPSPSGAAMNACGSMAKWVTMGKV